MRDMFSMLKQAKKLQSTMKKIQEEITKLEVEGISGGGTVRLLLNGKGILTSIFIEPSLLNPSEKEILEDLIIAAHNDAKSKLETAISEKTSESAAGIPLPDDLKSFF